MNKVVKYMFIVFITILILVAIASYFNYRYDNAVGPNLITAFVGVAVSALVTLVLLKGQTKDEEEKDKNIQLFQYKQQCYTDFIRKVWACKSLDDFDKVEESMRNLIFVVNKDTLSELANLLKQARKECETYDKVTSTYAAITKLLRDDLLKDKEGVDAASIEEVFKACYYGAEENDVRPKVNEDIQEQHVSIEDNNNNISFNNNALQTIWEEYEKGNVQCWHFNAWTPETQSKSLEERDDTGNALLSLFEYGEDWRTQRLRQVNKGDIVFLFYRGGSGYVGMYRATGTVVISPKGEGYLLEVNDIKDKIVPLEEAEQYDIYGELRGGATSVASIRVEPEITKADMKQTYNPINVIRQTIVRTGEDNTWELLHYFDKMQNV